MDPVPAAVWDEPDPATEHTFAQAQLYLDLIDRVVTAAREMADGGYFTNEEIARALLDAATGVKPVSSGAIVMAEALAPPWLNMDDAKAAVASGLALAKAGQ